MTSLLAHRAACTIGCISIAAFVAGLAGCARKSETARAGDPVPQASAAPKPAEQGAPAATAEAAPPPAPAAADRAARKGRGGQGERSAGPPSPSPEQRPGLGTQWGETRSSHITTVPFVRADADTPLRDGEPLLQRRARARARWRRAPGFRRDTRRRRSRSPNGAVTVGLRDERGRFLSGFVAGGKNYVVGEAGQRYTIVRPQQHRRSASRSCLRRRARRDRRQGRVVHEARLHRRPARASSRSTASARAPTRSRRSASARSATRTRTRSTATRATSASSASRSSTSAARTPSGRARRPTAAATPTRSPGTSRRPRRQGGQWADTGGGGKLVFTPRGDAHLSNQSP